VGRAVELRKGNVRGLDENYAEQKNDADENALFPQFDGRAATVRDSNGVSGPRDHPLRSLEVGASNPAGKPSTWRRGPSTYGTRQLENAEKTGGKYLKESQM